MAQAMASMTGLSQGVLPSRRVGRARAAIRASAAEGEAVAGRRAVLGLVATGVVGGAFSKAVHAETVKTIKVGAPPPLSGGLRKCPPACILRSCRCCWVVFLYPETSTYFLADQLYMNVDRLMCINLSVRHA
jgi:hypothetical protein